MNNVIIHGNFSTYTDFAKNFPYGKKIKIRYETIGELIATVKGLVDINLQQICIIVEIENHSNYGLAYSDVIVSLNNIIE